VYEAQVRLEAVMRLYYLRHSFELYDPWIIPSMVMLGNIAMDEIEANTGNETEALSFYRSTLILSAQSLESQARHCHIGALVSIQLQNRMTPGDLQLVRTYTKSADSNSSEQALIAQHSHSQWPIPIKEAYVYPESAILHHLIEPKEESNLELEHI
jgi:hypothetical protein